MPVPLNGPPEHDFTMPLGLLSDCHRRIERFLGVLAAISEQAAHRDLTPDEQGALERALQYFRKAAPVHTADEEQSLFPRLEQAPDSPERQQALARLAALESDHRKADADHAEMDQLGRKWLVQKQLSPEELARWRTLVSELLQMYAAHIAVEDHELFPLAASVLSQEDQHAIGREMAARRGLTQPLTQLTR